MDAIRVFVVDDHPMIRHGLAAMLRAESNMQWVGDACDGAEAVRLLPAIGPDVVLMDLMMPKMDGIAAIAALRPVMPKTHFVVLTSMLDPIEVRRAMSAGAAGFLLKNASSQELVNVILSAARGQRVMAPEVTDALIADNKQRPVGVDLTSREHELLSLMATGLSNQDIATRLSIAMPTVKFHVTNILAKLHADNRTEAVLIALKHRLVSLD